MQISWLDAEYRSYFFFILLLPLLLLSLVVIRRIVQVSGERSEHLFISLTSCSYLSDFFRERKRNWRELTGEIGALAASVIMHQKLRPKIRMVPAIQLLLVSPPHDRIMVQKRDVNPASGSLILA